MTQPPVGGRDAPVAVVMLSILNVMAALVLGRATSGFVTLALRGEAPLTLPAVAAIAFAALLVVAAIGLAAMRAWARRLQLALCVAGNVALLAVLPALHLRGDLGQRFGPFGWEAPAHGCLLAGLIVSILGAELLVRPSMRDAFERGGASLPMPLPVAGMIGTAFAVIVAIVFLISFPHEVEARRTHELRTISQLRKAAPVLQEHRARTGSWPKPEELPSLGIRMIDSWGRPLETATLSRDPANAQPDTLVLGSRGSDGVWDGHDMLHPIRAGRPGERDGVDILLEDGAISRRPRLGA